MKYLNQSIVYMCISKFNGIFQNSMVYFNQTNIHKHFKIKWNNKLKNQLYTSISCKVQTLNSRNTIMKMKI
jgi:hypothetical protein